MTRPHDPKNYPKRKSVKNLSQGVKEEIPVEIL